MSTSGTTRSGLYGEQLWTPISDTFVVKYHDLYLRASFLSTAIQNETVQEFFGRAFEKDEVEGVIKFIDEKLHVAKGDVPDDFLIITNSYEIFEATVSRSAQIYSTVLIPWATDVHMYKKQRDELHKGIVYYQDRALQICGADCDSYDAMNIYREATAIANRYNGNTISFSRPIFPSGIPKLLDLRVVNGLSVLLIPAAHESVLAKLIAKKNERVLDDQPEDNFVVTKMDTFALMGEASVDSGEDESTHPVEESPSIKESFKEEKEEEKNKDESKEKEEKGESSLLNLLDRASKAIPD